MPNDTISCKFSFYSQEQTLTFICFQQLEPYDLVLVQKKLISLKFSYTIPNTHLSFDVINTKIRFVFNASYNAFVADRGWSYSTFLSNYKGPPLSAAASGSGPPSLLPDPSQSTTLEQVLLGNLQPPPTEFIPSPQTQLHTPPNQHLELTTTPSRPLQETTRPNLITTLAENRLIATVNLKSRLSTENIAILKTAIESFEETASVSLESDLVLNRLEKKTNWVNKDIALLILAINGVIPVIKPTGTVPLSDEFHLESDQEEESVTQSKKTNSTSLSD